MKDVLFYEKVIRKSPLFCGMTAEDIRKAVALFGGEIKKYPKGEMLHLPMTAFARFGFVLSGKVHACCDDIDGNRMIMADVSEGVTFGESLCFLGIKDSPVYVYASEDSVVLWLSADVLFDGGTDGTVPGLQRRFASLLASRTLAMNSRIQILSKKTIREKLTVYFGELSSACGKDVFEIPMNREDMASYIGADRAAMSRELSRMKRDGIIDYHKNTVRLIRKIGEQ